jgi:benzoyl-CoA reductase subunit C
MVTLEKFRYIVENSHEYAKDWKLKKEGKVCGCLCGNVPEEIIYAAGILPVRIFGSHQTSRLAQTYIQDNRCSFSRDLLEQGLIGQYDYLDGLTYTQGCIVTGLVYAYWNMHRPLAWSHMIWPPFLHDNPKARETMVGELNNFKLSLEKWNGHPISEEALTKSVEIYRTNRQLLKQIYELNKAHPSIYKGSDIFRIVAASMLMDKEEHNHLLQQLLQKKQESSPQSNERIRLMVISSGYDAIAFAEAVESIGADIVIDDHCIGSRYFWGNATSDEDPMTAIALWYLKEKSSCPQYDYAYGNRITRVLQFVREYDVQAVIILAQKFCGTHQLDQVDIVSALDEEGIPNLVIESDATIPIGQYRMRIEAMLEMIQGVIL